MVNPYVEFLLGNERPLLSLARGHIAANRVATPEEEEALAALDAMHALKAHLDTSKPVGYKVVGFEKNHLHIACPDDHPPLIFPLYSHKLALRVKIACPLCTKAEGNPNVIVGFLCRHHPDVILKRGLRCPKCEDNGLATALDGSKIELLNTGRLRQYNCPMHGNFEIPCQRQKVECPTCNSLRGVNDYAATFTRTDREQLKRLKDSAAPIVRAALKKTVRNKQLSPQKIAMINALVKRCFDYDNNMHLLHIFPSEEFIEGSWLVGHTKHIAFSESSHEYLMPLPQDLIDPLDGQKAVLMNTASVLCDLGWRTAHWSRHKEYV